MVPPAGENEVHARLRDAEAMLDAIIEHAIIQLDLAGTVVRWGPGAELMTGYSAAEMVGKSVSVLYTDEDRAAGLVDRELAAVRETGRFEFEGWRVRKDGRRFRAAVVVTAIQDAAGVVTGLTKVLRDLTAEQQRADSMFHDLLESAPDAMVIVASDGRITLANAQADRLFGYRREDLIGREVEMLIPPRFRGGHERYRSSFFTDPRPRQMGVGLELWGLRRDGTEFPIDVSLSPLRTDEGLLVSAAIRDVTERREQEQRLRRQHEEIMELSTPVIQVWDKVLTLPVIGTLDSARAARLTEGLLFKIAETQAEVVIFDISGVPTIDTQVAQHLLGTVQAAALMGTISIMCGVRPETAQSMVHLGIDIGQLRSRTTLRHALQLALTLLAERAEAAAGVATLMGPAGAG